MWPENGKLEFTRSEDGNPKQWQSSRCCFWCGKLKRSGGERLWVEGLELKELGHQVVWFFFFKSVRLSKGTLLSPRVTADMRGRDSHEPWSFPCLGKCWEADGGNCAKAVRGLIGKFDLPRGSGQAFRMKWYLRWDLKEKEFTGQERKEGHSRWWKKNKQRPCG